MFTTEIFVKGEDKPVGVISTSKEITGSIINQFNILNFLLRVPETVEEEKCVTWTLGNTYAIPGSPRGQQIWNFSKARYNPLDRTIVIHDLILRPEGMCVACAGTGTYRASRHKATAKCPSCKGHGYIKGVWIDDELVDKREEPAGTSGSQAG